MTNKLTSHRYSWVVILLLLAACAPAQPNISEIQTKAVAMARTSIPLTQTALPTATPSPTFTSTVTAILILSTPTLALPPFIPIATPDVYQAEHWKEYQDALTKMLIPSDYVPFALCEWDILGRANQEVYVWAVCSTGGYQSMDFAVVYLDVNGVVQTVEHPSHGRWDSDVRRMFPLDVREKMASYDANGRTLEMLNHIEWRRSHPEEPPLIVLSTMPAPSTP
jgi:hypothetical protein